jgi:hypothetical protein
MGDVEREVEEEGLVLVFLDETARFPHDDIAEMSSILPVFFRTLLKIVSVRTDPIEKMGIIIDTTAAVTEELVEALRQGFAFGDRSKMPLAEQRGFVSRALQHFGDRDFVGGHSRITGSRVDVSGDTTSLRIAAREQ